MPLNYVWQIQLLPGRLSGIIEVCFVTTVVAGWLMVIATIVLAIQVP
jgi:hypothetical protein